MESTGAPRSGEDSTVPASTNAVSVARLQVIVETVAGEGARREILLEDDCFRIGSHESNDLVLDDPRVSRFHCRIERAAAGWTLTDDGSLNGTYLSGIRVRIADLKMPESTLLLGGSTLRVRELPSTARAIARHRTSMGALQGRSQAMQKLYDVLDRVAKADANVLIEGESGTGKELVAAEIVGAGARATKPFVVVDCGAVSPSLIESQLFGHARGAFTGADHDRAGAFESADGGTIFLDEIGELPLEMQPKLLRAIEAREVRRLGESKARRVDVRILAATNRHLEREVNHRRFREDLFFRLSVVTVRVPPLRERIDDIELLVATFLKTLDAESKRHLFTADVIDELAAHEWPGNVRELRNYIERAVVLDTVPPAATPAAADSEVSLPSSEGGDGGAPPKVDLDVSFKDAKERLVTDFERRYLTALLAWSGGNVSRAARRARMDRMNLHRLVQLYGIPAGRALKD
jgi:DNA-binding NtrC family response regulator